MSCFTVAPCDVCERCGQRPGFVCGMQGFGLRQKGHDSRCARRLQGRSPVVQTDNFVSATSRFPQDSQARPSEWRTSTAPTNWASAFSRPSTETTATPDRESASSRPSTQTIRTLSSRASTDLSRASLDKFDRKIDDSLVDSPRLQDLIRAALEQAFESGELLGMLGADLEGAHIQRKLCQALDEALDSGELAFALGNERRSQSSLDMLDKGVPWPPSSSHDEVMPDKQPSPTASFRSFISEVQDHTSIEVQKAVQDTPLAVFMDFDGNEVASFTASRQASSEIHDKFKSIDSIEKLEDLTCSDSKSAECDGSKLVPRLSNEEQDEARLIYDLCDTEGSDNVNIEDVVDVALKHHDVAQFMGLDTQEKLAPEVIREQILAMIGRAKGITWEKFDAFISERRANMADKSSPLPRLSEEKEIDLIFEMCDVNKSGRISFTEFVAFCVKHPKVAEVVGMKDKDSQKRPQADVLFAQLDSDGSGKVTRQELRTFIWQRRGNVAA